MVYLSRVRVTRYDGRLNSVENREDVVVREAIVRLFINGEHVATFMSTPDKLKEQAIGFLFSEGVIKDLSDLEEVYVRGVDVYVKLSSEAAWRMKLRGKDVVISSACGGYSRGFKVSLVDALTLSPVGSDLRIEASFVIKAVEELNKRSMTYRQTGGTHAAALFNRQAEALAVAEDVSRHNAFDKIIGESLLKGVKLSEVFVACTGRLTLELVLKSIRCGIPIASSVSAPTSLGVETAEHNNLTLVGFVRGRRFNVYTHPWRIIT